MESLGSTDVSQSQEAGEGQICWLAWTRLTSVGHLLGKDTVISLYYVILSHYSPLITIILVL